MREMIPVAVLRNLLVMSLSVLLVSLAGGLHLVGGQGPVKQPVGAALPDNLFIMFPPPNAVDVRVARQSAQQGKPIVLQGRVGGALSPIADNRAIFLMSDFQLPLCHAGCGCPTPWDSCCAPRDQILANVATVQVADQGGKPLKANLKGVNGLSPMVEVVVKGTVSVKDKNSLLVNAQHIYVKPQPQ